MTDAKSLTGPELEEIKKRAALPTEPRAIIFPKKADPQTIAGIQALLYESEARRKDVLRLVEEIERRQPAQDVFVRQKVEEFADRLRKRAGKECEATVRFFKTRAGQHGYRHGFIEALNARMVQEIISELFPPKP